MQIVKQIPIKSHLKKWLVQQYNVNGDRIMLDPGDRLSKKLYSMFQYFPINKPDERVFKAKEYLSVQLTPFLVKHHRTFISHKSVIDFNDWVGQQFNEDLFASLYSTGKRKGDKKKAIEEFMDQYNLIEGEDINYDSLKRSYDRYLANARYKEKKEEEYNKVGTLEIII